MWFTFWKIDKTFYIVVSFWNVCPVHLEMSSTSWKKRKILIFVREKKNCLEMLENFNMDSLKSKSFFWYFNTSKVLTLIHYQGFWLVKIACLCHACCVGKIEPPHDKANKMACTPSEDSDQPGHPPSLIRVFAVRMKKAWVLSYPLSAQRRLWSDWADAQADLSLCWAHNFVGFAVRQLRWRLFMVLEFLCGNVLERIVILCTFFMRM